MNKNKLIVILSVLIMLCCSLFAVGCDFADDDMSSSSSSSSSATEECAHEFTGMSTDAAYLKSAATCTHKATYYYSCSKCGEKGTETFTSGELAAHTWNDGEVLAEASCRAAGAVRYTCTVCFAMEERSIPKTEHTPGDWIIGDGVHYKVCRNEGCGEKILSEAHQIVETTIVEAKCYQEGRVAVKCEVCGYSDEKTVAKLAHDFSGAYISDGAEHWHKCADCDAIDKKVAHNYSEELIIKQATCSQEGKKTLTCVCGKSITQTIAKLAHDYNVTVVDPTCTEGGYTLHSCKNCVYSYKDEIKPANGHTWGSGNVTVEPTCKTDGEIEYKCECGAKKTETVPANGQHDLVMTVVEPTCIDDGYTLVKCRLCDYEYITDETHATDHMYDEGTVTVEPNCTSSGVIVYKCTVCSVEKQEILPMTEHNLKVETVAPDCLNGGYSIEKCENCTYSRKFDETEPFGHAWDGELDCENGRKCNRCGTEESALGHSEICQEFEATCEKGAYTLYTCERCKASREVLNGQPLGHDIKGVTPEKTLKDGKTCVYILSYNCTACGKTAKTEEIEEHSYTAKLTKPATCSDKGIKTLTCSKCSHAETEEIEIDADAHKWDDGVTENGETTYTCELCTAVKTVVSAEDGEHTVNADDLNGEKEIDFGSASMKFDKETLDGVAGKDLTLSAGTLDEETRQAAISDLTPEAKERLGDKPIYNFTMSSGDQTITEFNGKATITIPYELADGEDVDHIAVWYVNGTEVTPIPAKYSVINGKGYVTFETEHFSYYTVTKLTPAERCAIYGHNSATRTVPDLPGRRLRFRILPALRIYRKNQRNSCARSRL